MIKYKLICKDCDLKFDSWFASSNEYERLKKKKLLNCHNCNSVKVEKTIMAPQLISHNSKNDEKIKLEKYNKVKKTIKDYQKFIKDNFNYVGDNFPYEARSIHYNGKKNSTIKSEINNNPRLQVSSKDEYADIMNNLNLPNPKMLDVAVPANLKGLTLEHI